MGVGGTAVAVVKEPLYPVGELSAASSCIECCTILTDRTHQYWRSRRRFDEAVRKRARKFLKHELIDDGGWIGYEEDSSSSEDGLRGQGGDENDFRSSNVVKDQSGSRAWSSNDWKGKVTAEDEHRRKLQIQQWKKSR